jgi:beta-lactam-binding protein with PASTA domain
VKRTDIVRVTRAGVEGAAERLSPRSRRALWVGSAVLAAVVCAALVANYVVMPIIVKRGDLVAAPDLIGRPLAEAQRVLAELHLNLRVTDERPDPTYSGGKVVRQSPEPGVDTKRGRTVTVSVSSGIDLRAVPALAGLPIRQAELELSRAGLVAGEVLEVTSDRVDRGRVIGSTPGEGTLAIAGQGITLLVSLGRRPAELVMPSLVGRGPDEARAIAEGLGLVVRSVTYGRTDRVARFREVVIMQDPPAGARIMEGEGITLRVGRD